MHTTELRRLCRRAVFATGLIVTGAIVPATLPAQVAAQDPGVTQGTRDMDMDRDDDGMDLGWLGLLGLAGLLGLRRRDNTDYSTTRRTTTP